MQQFNYKIQKKFIAKCIRCFITKSYSFITKCVGLSVLLQNVSKYCTLFKMRRLLQNTSVQRISECHKEMEIENRLIPTTMSQFHEIQSISGHPPLLSALELVTRTTYLYEK